MAYPVTPITASAECALARQFTTLRPHSLRLGPVQELVTRRAIATWPFLKSEPRKSGSHRTPCWREGDSNPRSPAIGTMVFAHTMRPQPSVPRLYGALGRARRDPRLHREAQNAGSFAATSSASDLRGTPGAPSWTKLELEIGFGDFEHLAASPFAFSATLEICRDDRVGGRAKHQKA